MASYRVHIKPSALKELERVPLSDRRRLAKRLEQFAEEPRPGGTEKLSGSHLYRLRQGDYRIVYEVVDSTRTVTVYKIGHRREVYR